MKPIWSIAFLLSLLVITSASSRAADVAKKPEKQTVSGKIDWVYSYEAGKELSKSNGKPIFIVIRCER